MGYRILLIGPDPANAASVAGPLTSAGFEVVVSGDRVDGLATFHRMRPDLTLIDTVLPDDRAMQLCQQLKASEHGRSTRVVILDGESTGPQTEFDLAAFGCDEHLRRPFTDLVGACRRLLDEAAAARPEFDAALDDLEARLSEPGRDAEETFAELAASAEEAVSTDLDNLSDSLRESLRELEEESRRMEPGEEAPRRRPASVPGMDVIVEKLERSDAPRGVPEIEEDDAPDAAASGPDSPPTLAVKAVPDSAPLSPVDPSVEADELRGSPEAESAETPGPEPTGTAASTEAPFPVPSFSPGLDNDPFEQATEITDALEVVFSGFPGSSESGDDMQVEPSQPSGSAAWGGAPGGVQGADPISHPELLGIDSDLVAWDSPEGRADRARTRAKDDSIPGAIPFESPVEPALDEPLASDRMEEAGRSGGRRGWIVAAIVITGAVAAALMWQLPDTVPTVADPDPAPDTTPVGPVVTRPSTESGGPEGDVLQTFLAEPALIASVSPAEILAVGTAPWAETSGEEVAAASSAPIRLGTPAGRGSTAPPEAVKPPVAAPAEETGSQAARDRDAPGPAARGNPADPVAAGDDPAAADAAPDRTESSTTAAVRDALPDETARTPEDPRQDETIRLGTFSRETATPRPTGADGSAGAETGAETGAEAGASTDARQPARRPTSIDLSAAIARTSRHGEADPTAGESIPTVEYVGGKLEPTVDATDEGVDPPVLRRRPDPGFPQDAVKAAYGTELVLRVRIDERGRVVRVVVLSGERDSILTTRAVQAAFDSIYDPGRREGKPVPTWTVERFRF